MSKVSSFYGFPETYGKIREYLKSKSSLNFDEENYLINELPKHFLGVLEGTVQEEYDHSLYTRFGANSFITLKKDGNIYMSDKKDESHIINNWKEASILEKIEINNKEDKFKLDDIAKDINNIQNELAIIYSSEYSSSGRFLGLKFPSENYLIAYTNKLKTFLEQLDQQGDQIIRGNNPKIDEKFAKANELHKKNDSMFNQKFNFDIFGKELIGLNLNSKELYNNYLTFWNEPNIRKFIEEDLGFHFENHTFQQQVYFLDYLKGVTIKEAKQIKDFSEKYGVAGFNSFLSIAHGGKKIATKILAIGDGEKIPGEVAKEIFVKYGEIIDSADKVEEEIKNIYKNEEIPVSIYKSTREVLLKEGVGLLLKILNELENGEKIDEDKILKELEEVKTNTIILGASYIELYKEGIKVPIEDITKIEKISSENLTEKEKLELLKVYENGRPKTTYENPEHLKLLTEEFKGELENKNTEIINIRFNGDIIIFAIADKKGEDDLYIGGLTFVDEVRNPVIAVSAMESILKEFKNYNIKALVDSKNPIMSMYIKRFGFKIIRELPREENAGELYYEIERPKTSDKEKIIRINNNLEKAA